MHLAILLTSLCYYNRKFMVLLSANGKTVGNEITWFEQSLGDEVEVLPVRSQFIRTAWGCTMFYCSLCFRCLLVRNTHL